MNAPVPAYVRIDCDRLRELVADAEFTSDECCGFLLGYDRSQRIVTNVLPATNIARNKSVEFKVDPLEYLRAEQLAEKSGLELLGVYHSHPNCAAIPSESDRRDAQPHFSYVIVSTRGQQFDHIRSWRLNQKREFEEEIIIG